MADDVAFCPNASRVRRQPNAAPASAPRLASGTRVRPVEGAFVDQVGELMEMSDGKRVKVLLQILGGQRPVVMSQSAVEVVE